MIHALALILLAPGASFAGPQWGSLPIAPSTTQQVESGTSGTSGTTGGSLLRSGPLRPDSADGEAGGNTVLGSSTGGLRSPRRGDETGGETPKSSGGGPQWGQSTGAIADRDEGPPPPPGIPGEAMPDGSQSLVFYTVHFGGGPNGTKTGYAEDFMVYAPSQAKPRPLLVAFHKFGVSQLDIWINTRFFQEAVSRGWYIIAPLSASGLHMGCQEGQVNTEMALDWMMANFNIDRERIYGVGFSMGGGAVTNFAARHLDHNKYAFAAVVDHTGGIAHWDTYNKSLSTQFIFDFWFGNGSAPPDTFKMAQACLLEFDPNTLAVKLNNNLARNLTTVPTKVVRASIEPLATAYLQLQCDIFVNHLQSLGGTVEYEIVPYFGHSWASLDQRAAVDWLAPHRLKVPTSHATLADSDRRYWHFDVIQDAAGAFTPFLWTVDTVQNQLTLTKTRNLNRLGVDMASAGFATDQTFTASLATADNLGDELAIQDWPAPPTSVFRDGVQQFVNWTYQGPEQLLVLQEWDGTQTHVWVVNP